MRYRPCCLKGPGWACPYFRSPRGWSAGRRQRVCETLLWRGLRGRAARRSEAGLRDLLRGARAGSHRVCEARCGGAAPPGAPPNRRPAGPIVTRRIVGAPLFPPAPARHDGAGSDRERVGNICFLRYGVKTEFLRTGRLRSPAPAGTQLYLLQCWAKPGSPPQRSERTMFFERLYAGTNEACCYYVLCHPGRMLYSSAHAIHAPSG